MPPARRLPTARPLTSGRRAGRILTATDYGRDVLVNSPDGWEVEQPWLWWDGPGGANPGTPVDTPPGWGMGNPIPGAGRAPWMDALPTVERCRSLICDTLAGMPWQVFRGREQLRTPDWVLDPQALRQDDRVSVSVQDVRLSAVEFWSTFILSALELGEGVAYIPNRDANNAPLPPLFLLNPTDLRVDGGQYWVGDTLLDPQELLVVRNRVWPGTWRGLGVWDQFHRGVGLGWRLRDFADGMLTRGIPAGYLKVTAPDLNQAEAEDLRNRWMAAHGGRRRRIAVLNATTEFHPLSIDPQAMQLVQLMQLSAWEIALLYGVPPYKLGLSMGGTSQTYANVEQIGTEFIQDTLLLWARRIESACDACFPRGTSLKLNMDQLKRADMKTRYDSYTEALAAGWMTVDEVRELEDMPPMDQTAPTAPTAPVLHAIAGGGAG